VPSLAFYICGFCTLACGCAGGHSKKEIAILVASVIAGLIDVADVIMDLVYTNKLVQSGHIQYVATRIGCCGIVDTSGVFVLLMLRIPPNWLLRIAHQLVAKDRPKRVAKDRPKLDEFDIFV
jgi:hypothetical protein